MNTREEIIQAIEDYQAGRMGRIPENNGQNNVERLYSLHQGVATNMFP